MKECNFSSVKLDLVRGLTEVLPWDSRNICQPIPNPDFEKLDLEQIDHKQDEARFNHDLLMQIQHFREIIIDNKVQIRVALIHGQEGFHFRWFEIKGIAFRISITLISTI